MMQKKPCEPVEDCCQSNYCDNSIPEEAGILVAHDLEI